MTRNETIAELLRLGFAKVMRRSDGTHAGLALAVSARPGAGAIANAPTLERHLADAVIRHRLAGLDLHSLPRFDTATVERWG